MIRFVCRMTMTSVGSRQARCHYKPNGGARGRRQAGIEAGVNPAISASIAGRMQAHYRCRANMAHIKTVRASFWPWLYTNLLRRSLLTRKRFTAKPTNKFKWTITADLARGPLSGFPLGEGCRQKCINQVAMGANLTPKRSEAGPRALH